MDHVLLIFPSKIYSVTRSRIPWTAHIFSSLVMFLCVCQRQLHISSIRLHCSATAWYECFYLTHLCMWLIFSYSKLLLAAAMKKWRWWRLHVSTTARNAFQYQKKLRLRGRVISTISILEGIKIIFDNNTKQSNFFQPRYILVAQRFTSQRQGLRS